MHEHKIFNPENLARLESSERKKLIPPDSILNLMNIKPDDYILDFGTGIGYFAIPMQNYINENGKIIAFDISKEMINELEKRISLEKNKILTKCGSIDELINDNYKFDKILLAFVFHEINNQIEFLTKLKSLLKQDGEITIVEWKKEETSGGPPLHHRISKIELENLIKEAKLNLNSSLDINEVHYAIKFK